MWYLLPLLLLPQDDAPAEADPVTRAWQAFSQAQPAIQDEVMSAIEAQVEASENESLARIKALIATAREKLPTAPEEELEYYDPKVYARGLVKRAFLPADDEVAQYTYRRFQPWASKPFFSHAVHYDFAADRGRKRASELGPSERLWNRLWGYPRDADHALAWLELRWDHADEMDALARYFAHAYCDRDGNAFPGVTLYDAFASGLRIEMPDVDAIAYARLIEKNHSYRSPIPADRRRDRLYDAIKTGFLPYFQHRSFVEAAARIYLNPEAPLRPEHEELRRRLLYAFALDGSDVEKFRARIVRAKARDAFLEQIDAEMEKDVRGARRIHDERTWRNEARAAVSKIAHEVLRSQGFLRD